MAASEKPFRSIAFRMPIDDMSRLEFVAAQLFASMAQCAFGDGAIEIFHKRRTEWAAVACDLAEALILESNHRNWPTASE